MELIPRVGVGCALRGREGGERGKKKRLREAETRATEERLMEMSDRLSE